MKNVIQSNRPKQEQEVVFSRKKNTVSHSPIFLNNSKVKLSPNQKHLGLAAYSKLLFSELINNKQRQSNKIVVSFENCK